MQAVDLASQLSGACVLQAVTSSVAKTGRLLVSHEAPLSSGFGAELVAEVSRRCFLSLEAPPVRVSTGIGFRVFDGGRLQGHRDLACQVSWKTRLKGVVKPGEGAAKGSRRAAQGSRKQHVLPCVEAQPCRRTTNRVAWLVLEQLSDRGQLGAAVQCNRQLG
eukprot:GHRQ01020436.1.p2 GENE.GHRQ01020436.1~~GHRQ01020436.1.p2  ORF type:complete len:162 (+),score=34.90 GHRQ01020436.1:442-927(+)